jgi:hypothetical protein
MTLAEEPRVKRIAPKAYPKLLTLPPITPTRIEQMEALIRLNCPTRERSMLKAFRMFLP